MNYRKFGNTDLKVSEVGFGAWGIGGPAMAGKTAIGWGEVDDNVSKEALKKAYDEGINFYDTADFYGLGHSEKLIGEVFGNSDKVIIASKVGHVQHPDTGEPLLDYTPEHIIEGCEASLKRLKRETIDYYQLHSARVTHFQQEDIAEAMEKLQAQGKIRYWGLSLITFNPFPEADYLLKNKLGSGFQLVLSIINQKAMPIVEDAKTSGFGVIARMALHFGLLTGKFSGDSDFAANDHRKGRLPGDIIEESNELLNEVWELAEKHNISKTGLALSFVLSIPGVSTVIPGIKTPEQVTLNTKDIIQLPVEDVDLLKKMYEKKLIHLLNKMEKLG
ncbi:MAG: oxidoreductase [Melioribacteraceae bacterium]|nr:MAG: oxidoreductase [Melioribacteraceae bacterium]